MADDNNMTIDSLNIEIEAQATQASSVLSTLEEKMRTLGKALTAFNTSAKGIRDAKSALSDLNGAAKNTASLDSVTKTYKQLSSALRTFSKIDMSAVSAQLIRVAPVLNDLNKSMSSFTAQDTRSLQDMTRYYTSMGKALSSLTSAPKVFEKINVEAAARNLESLRTNLDSFFQSMRQNEPTMQKFTDFAASIKTVSHETRTATGAQNKLGDSISRSAKSAKGFAANIASVTKRLLVFKPLYALYNAVTQDVTDALKTAAFVDTGFDKTMSDLTGSIKSFNGVLASVAIPLIKTFAPILTQTLNVLYPVLDGLAALLAAINGETKYWKADRVEMESWTESANEANSAMKQLIGGFDELNIWSRQTSASSIFSGEMADVPEWMQAIGKVFNKDVLLAGALGLGLTKLAEKIMGNLVPSLNQKNTALKNEVEQLTNDTNATGLFSNALSALTGNVSMAGASLGNAIVPMSMFAAMVADARSEVQNFNNTPLEIHTPDTTAFNNAIYGSVSAVASLAGAIAALNGAQAGKDIAEIGQAASAVRDNISTGKYSMVAFGDEFRGSTGRTGALAGGLIPGIPTTPGISASDFGYSGELVSIPADLPQSSNTEVWTYDPYGVLREIGRTYYSAKDRQRYFGDSSGATAPLFDAKISGGGGGETYISFGDSIASFLRKKGIKAAARGDVATSPSVRLIGEYAGAWNNPEIVTPQNIMYDTVIEANRDMVAVIVQVGQAIVEAIENKEVSTSEDANSIGRKAVSYINSEIRRGKKPLAAT